jgi:hypothetical protein
VLEQQATSIKQRAAAVVDPNLSVVGEAVEERGRRSAQAPGPREGGVWAYGTSRLETGSWMWMARPQTLTCLAARGMERVGGARGHNGEAVVGQLVRGSITLANMEMGRMVSGRPEDVELSPGSAERGRGHWEKSGRRRR